MDALLRGWWRALAALRAVELWLAMALLAGIVVAITVQVVSRYGFDRPIVWVEDAATFAFIWAVFLGAAAGHKDLRHIRIETFLGRLPPAARALANALLQLVILGVAALVARYAWQVMETESRSETISLPVNLPRHWFYSVPLFAALVSIAATAAQLALAYLMLALTGRPVEAEEDAARRAARERELDEAEIRAAEGSL